MPKQTTTNPSATEQDPLADPKESFTDMTGEVSR